MGGLLDPLMQGLLSLPSKQIRFDIDGAALALWIGLSLLALRFGPVERLLPYLAAAVFIGAVYQVT